MHNVHILMRSPVRQTTAVVNRADSRLTAGVVICYKQSATLGTRLPDLLTNFQIHSVSLTILVSIHLLIHFSTELISVIIHTLIIHHSFTLLLQAQNLPFQQILSTVDFFYLLDCLTITGLDRTYHACDKYGRQA